MDLAVLPSYSHHAFSFLVMTPIIYSVYVLFPVTSSIFKYQSILCFFKLLLYYHPSSLLWIFLIDKRIVDTFIFNWTNFYSLSSWKWRQPLSGSISNLLPCIKPTIFNTFLQFFYYNWTIKRPVHKSKKTIRSSLLIPLSWDQYQSQSMTRWGVRF